MSPSKLTQSQRLTRVTIIAVLVAVVFTVVSLLVLPELLYPFMLLAGLVAIFGCAYLLMTFAFFIAHWVEDGEWVWDWGWMR